MLLEIITPEKKVLHQEVDEILAPTSQGQIGILPHHINLLTKLTEGELVIKKDNKEKFFALAGGFLQVKKGTVTILADYAASTEEINIEKAIEAQKRAEEVLKKKKEQISEKDFAIAEAELRKSILQIDVARRRKRRI